MLSQKSERRKVFHGSVYFIIMDGTKSKRYIEIFYDIIKRLKIKKVCTNFEKQFIQQVI